MIYGSSSSSLEDSERDDADAVKRVTSLFSDIDDEAARLPEHPKVI